MYKSFLLPLIGIAALAGCNSSTSTPTTSVTIAPAGTMVATVNGVMWGSGTVNGVTNTDAYASRFGANIVAIYGIAQDSSEIEIVLPNLKLGFVGADSLGATTGNYALYSPKGVPDTLTSYVTIPTLNRVYSGSVTITAYDTTTYEISGQFEFTGCKVNSLSDTVLITNGSFTQLKFRG